MPSGPQVRIPFVFHLPSLQESTIHQATAFFFFFSKNTILIRKQQK